MFLLLLKVMLITFKRQRKLRESMLPRYGCMYHYLAAFVTFVPRVLNSLTDKSALLLPKIKIGKYHYTYEPI